MTVLMHDGAHGLMYKNRKLNDLASQWLCAYPVMTDTIPYRKVHSQHHKFTDTEKDPDLSLTAAFPTSWKSLARNNLAIWHKLNEKKLKQNRLKRLNEIEDQIFLRNLYKIGYSKIKKLDSDLNKKFLLSPKKKFSFFFASFLIISFHSIS